MTTCFWSSPCPLQHPPARLSYTLLIESRCDVLVFYSSAELVLVGDVDCSSICEHHCSTNLIAIVANIMHSSSSALSSLVLGQFLLFTTLYSTFGVLQLTKYPLLEVEPEVASVRELPASRRDQADNLEVLTYRCQVPPAQT
jgi:hypothetical protein